LQDKRQKVTIKIPKLLYENLKEIIKVTGFNSVTDFVVYVLRDIASSRARGEDEPLTREEVKLIRDRLKSLGYL
jgi:metal-responsive CopG/Arc/MetJ family transcriptional regulator